MDSHQIELSSLPLGTKIYDMAMIASHWHGSQRYGDVFPYMYHLLGVANQLHEYLPFPTMFTPEEFRTLQVIALGHDLLEDTEVPEASLRNIFGSEIMDAIVLLSNMTHDPVTGAKLNNRKERHGPTYARLVKSGNMMAAYVKLHDRLFNVRFSKKTKSSLFYMYKKEHASFRVALYPTFGEPFKYLWEELDFLLDFKPKETP